MKVVYIAHPIGGNVKENLEKVRHIVRKINLERSDVVPFAPYWLDCHALNDDIPSERERGIKNDKYLLESGIVDELWLYGNKISNGMQNEINIALIEQIEIIPMTKETSFYYKKMFHK